MQQWHDATGEMFLTSIFLENGYPLEFISRHKDQEERQVTCGPEKKPIYVRLPYKGHSNEEYARRELKGILRLYSAAKCVLLFSTTRVPVRSPKDPTPSLAQSSLIYGFQCDCGCNYVGRTGRRLQDRINEHIPQWLNTVEKKPPRSKKSPQSSIAKHLQTCTTTAQQARSSFKVLFKHPSPRQLRILEALVIKRNKPDLCAQKDHLLTLLLPW